MYLSDNAEKHKSYNNAKLGVILEWADFNFGMSPSVCAVHGMIRIAQLISTSHISSDMN